MKTHCMRLLAMMILLTIGFATKAQIISTFESDAEGWTFLDSSTPITVNHQISNGNPGGFISATYSSSISTTTESWFAPSKFLGNLVVRSLGKNFKFDLQQSISGTGSTTGIAEIRIERGGDVLIYQLPVKPAVAPLWTSYTIKLDETGGWLWSSTSGSAATRSQIISVLTNVTSIEIRGTFGTNASYTSGLDNVIIEQNPLQASPAVSSLSVTSGNPGTNVVINGSGFDADPANNAVYFSGMAGTVLSASTTQLSVTVPSGARYGSITVINKVTGLSTNSKEPFVPTFIGGGRIIPSSFKPKFDFLLGATAGNDVNGVRVADLDGDGWNDIIVTEQTPASVSIFRNLGSGGDLSTTSFSSKIILAGVGSSSGLHIVDLDGDGKQDIVTANNSTFATLRNASTSGNIIFETAETWPMSNTGFLSNVVDVDGDGRPELIGQHPNGSVAVDLWIVQNISSPGDILFASSVSYFGGSTLDAGAGVAVGDLDNDGKPELLVSHSFGDRFSILQNNSVPGTISLTNLGAIVTSQYNRGLSIADFNLDGKNDIVWKRSGTSSVYIRLNSNPGGALSPTDFTTEVVLTGDLGTFGGMSISDINGDGKPDIAATDNADLGVFENIYAGGVFDAKAFIPAYQYEGNGNSTYPTSPVAADLNGDGKPELLAGITNSAPIRISVYENKNVSAPVISVNTVSPLGAAVGATVTITGSNFSAIASENEVYFGAVQASVLSASETEIKAIVPAGATYSPVSVRKGELTSRYRLPFITTFSAGVTFDNTHFAPPVNFTLANANYDIEVGDLNRDGKPDLLAEANGGFAFRNTHLSGAITTGSLVPDDTISVNSFINPRLEDFDGDGLLDVASVNGLAHRNISTFAEISFQPSITTGLGASNMDMADFNNDGKIDFAVTADLSGTGDLVIRENRSIAGVFTDTGTYGTFSSNFIYNKLAATGGIVTEDFDGDGFADVATTNPLTDNISVYLNAGLLKVSASQFASRLDLAVGDNPGRIYKGDFDLDGKLDLMLYHSTGTSTTLLTVFHNTSTIGNLSFTRIDLTNPSATTVATIADLDGDGKPEIITTSETGNRFSIFKNIHTTGALSSASFAAPFNTTVTAPRGLATGDLNLDGKPEIIITRAAGLLVVYENLTPTNVAPIITSFTPASAPAGTSITITGINFGTTTAQNTVYIGGAKAQVISASSTSLQVTVPIGATSDVITVTVGGLTGYSTHRFVVTHANGAIAYNFKNCFPVNGTPREVSTADLNNDGHLDLIVTNTDKGFGTILFGKGNGKFDPPVQVTTGSGGIIAVGDYSGDGNLDLAFSNYSASLAASASVLINNGSGGFPSSNNYFLSDPPIGIGSGAVYLADADLNLDGKIDLVTAIDNIPGSLSVLINNGASFDTKVEYPVTYYPYSVNATDLNNDRYPDLVVANFFTQTISVLINNGLGEFPVETTYPSGNGTHEVEVADLNKDGMPDLIAINATSNTVSIYLNEGGVFNPKVDYPSGAGYQTEVELGDINGDGNLDIVTTSSGNQIYILQGNGNGVFGSPQPFTVGNVPYGITIGDFDEDGKPDVAVSNFGDGTVCVLLTSPTSTITITQQPVNPNNVCEGGNYVLSTDATGTTNITYKWQKYNTGTALFEDLNDGANYAGVNTKNLTITNATSLLAGDYRCMINGDLASTVYCNVATLIVNVKPANPVVTNAERCGPGSVTLTASGGAPGEFIWRTNPTVGEPIQNENNPTYTTPVISATTTYYVAVGNGLCESNMVPVTATILATPTAPTVTNAFSCGPGSVMLQASGGTNGQYQWYDVPSGGTPLVGEINSVFTTPVLSINTTYYVAINNGVCESARTPASATINDVPTKPIITSNETINAGVVTICLQPITLIAPAGFASYSWSNGQTTQQITVNQAGNYSVMVLNASGCDSPASDIIQAIISATCVNNRPTINTITSQTFIGGKLLIDLSTLISDPDGNLDPNSLQVIGNGTQKGGKTTLDGFILEIDYASAKFSGKDIVTIRVCDLLNVCFEAAFEIDVIGDINVYNGISPNGDTKNDKWEIEYITLFPDTQNNRVTIYNRWGDIVWEATNYDNNNVVFTGLNKNGSELSTGTYFYKIEFTGGRETISGYLSLKK